MMVHLMQTVKHSLLAEEILLLLNWKCLCFRPQDECYFLVFEKCKLDGFLCQVDRNILTVFSLVCDVKINQWKHSLLTATL